MIPQLSGLPGPPARQSRAPIGEDEIHVDGLVKLRLGHATFGSILLPELVFIKKSKWHFFQPSFFSPPVLALNVNPEVSLARFSVDVGKPRSEILTRLNIQIQSDQLVRRFDDGAQIYRCRISGKKDLRRFVSGVCKPRSDGDFDLNLRHVTNPKAFSSIVGSGKLRSSSWNLQGTSELANAAYVYLTSLPSIKSEEDLRRIAMSSSGSIQFQTTSDRAVEKTLNLKVYRESTAGRTASLVVNLASKFLSPPHMLIHRPTAEPTYYEVVGPEIYRVGVKPTKALGYAGGTVVAEPEILKIFDNLVVGDASTVEGLAAPYNEEETEQIVHIEKLDDGLDLFEYWQKHQITDQVSYRQPEPRTFKQ
ncbi:hypothetical protein [Maritalea sp. S77]|uniref:hypothetical protein n=1 Tax=Maritalea sp. S77 TaxID=3415125 RepID=UPI003C7DCCC0